MGEHYSSRVTGPQSADVRSGAESGARRAARWARASCLLAAVGVALGVGPMRADSADTSGVDDVEMVEIPAGWFVMGAAEADADREEYPVARIFVERFWIAGAYRVRGTPTVVLVDRQGRLLGRAVGSRERDTEGLPRLAAQLSAWPQVARVAHPRPRRPDRNGGRWQA